MCVKVGVIVYFEGGGFESFGNLCRVVSYDPMLVLEMSILLFS
jgi:hypothetical protein